MKHLPILVVLCWLAGACTGDDVDPRELAIDTDQSGAIDCADLEHVQACVADPHHAGCEHADVNHDGAIDDHDIHDLHVGLEATGHHCEL